MEYELIRSKRKTLAVQIKPDGSVVVRAPLRYPQREIDRFLRDRADWIRVHREKMLKRQEEQAASNPMQIVSNTYDSFYEDDIVSFATGPWKVTDNGIVCQNGKSFSVAGDSPVIIRKILTDRNTGDEKLELAWKKRNTVRTLTALRSVISSSTKIVELSRYGFPVTTETAKNLIEYLNRLCFCHIYTGNL